ncbi:MAG: hypothetical protein ABFS56_17220 [Pseudomonadota bacterium]
MNFEWEQKLGETERNKLEQRRKDAKNIKSWVIVLDLSLNKLEQK